jgi:dienelactone hydrolase
MAEVLLFHHSQGLTSGVRDFADTLRVAGHTVHVPDLYDGHVFDDIESGLAYADEVGFATVMGRGQATVEALPDGLVYAGFSLGVLPAQLLAQTRPGAKGALFFQSCVPTADFDTPWPQGVPVQIHGMQDDPLFAEEGDLDAARALVKETPHAELFLYPGDEHLFADSSLPSYVPEAAELLTERTLAFLAAIR